MRATLLIDRTHVRARVLIEHAPQRHSSSVGAVPVLSTHPLERAVANANFNAPRLEEATNPTETRRTSLQRLGCFAYSLILFCVSLFSLTALLAFCFASSPAVRVRHPRVDDTHGDAFAVWVAQGSPETPAPPELAALREAMVPVVLDPTHVAPVSDGAVSVSFHLPRFVVSRLELTPLKESAPAQLAPERGLLHVPVSRRSALPCPRCSRFRWR
jgi:hypothetical protein